MKFFRLKIMLLSLCAFVVIGILAVAAINLYVLNIGSKKIYTSIETTPKHEVALVLGARVYPGGRLSNVLEYRVNSAIELYRAGKVSKILMSGDNGDARYDEVTAMRNYAIKHGVDPDDVVRDYAGFRTLDSVLRAKELWGIDSMVIVTQRFHLQRALYIARKYGIAVDGYAAKDLNNPGGMMRLQVREVGARLLAFFDVLTGRNPRLMGRVENLSGLEQEKEENEKNASGNSTNAR